MSELILRELRKLGAGVKKGEKFRGTEIPTLAEVLAIMPQRRLSLRVPRRPRQTRPGRGDTYRTGA